MKRNNDFLENENAEICLALSVIKAFVLLEIYQLPIIVIDINQYYLVEIIRNDLESICSDINILMQEKNWRKLALNESFQKFIALAIEMSNINNSQVREKIDVLRKYIVIPDSSHLLKYQN